MASMTDRTLVGKIADFLLHNGSALTQPTSPLHLRVMTATGSNTAGGTEATGGNNPGYTAGGLTMGTPSFGASSAGVSASVNAVSWTATGTQTANLVGAEVWDTAGTPVRILQGALSSSITGVVNGDTIQFAGGAITADMSQW